MNDDEYVPSEEEVREEYIYGAQDVDLDGHVVVSFDEACARWDRFLARVRQEAKAEALRDAAEDLFYDGDSDRPMCGHCELYDRADDIEAGDPR